MRKSIDSAVLRALVNNHMDIVYYLILEKKCSLSDHTEFYNEEGRNTSTVLARACKSGDLELVKKLVEEFQAQTDGMGNYWYLGYSCKLSVNLLSYL